LWFRIFLARPDPDLAFLQENLYNFCKFIFKMVQFLFDYIHISLNL
jgi:hypothetical protein